MFALLLMLGSCASTPQSRYIQANTPDSLALAVELVDTPFYPQTQYQCGPAALATVLGFHGLKTSPEELSRQVYIPERKGSLQIEMIAAARSSAMLPYKLEPRLLALFSEIAAGNPVLVLQNLGFNWYPQWHYAVVVGYDLDKEAVILRSGTTKHRVTSFKVFERTWQRSGFWGLVIVPIDEMPKTAKPLAYLKTVYAFEDLGQFDLAHKAYRSASRRWPDNPDTWMTLGNMAFQNKNWPEALKAFSQASRLTPDSITAWNNLAYALHANACGKQAKMALQCALIISPHDENLQDSWQDLLVSPVGENDIDCPKVECY